MKLYETVTTTRGVIYVGYVRKCLGTETVYPFSDTYKSTFELSNGVRIAGYMPHGSCTIPFVFLYSNLPDKNGTHSLVDTPTPYLRKSVPLTVTNVNSNFSKPMTSKPSDARFSVFALFKASGVLSALKEQSPTVLSQFEAMFRTLRASDQNSTRALICLQLKKMAQKLFGINFRNLQKLDTKRLLDYFSDIYSGQAKKLLYNIPILTTEATKNGGGLGFYSERDYETNAENYLKDPEAIEIDPNSDATANSTENEVTTDVKKNGFRDPSSKEIYLLNVDIDRAIYLYCKQKLEQLNHRIADVKRRIVIRKSAGSPNTDLDEKLAELEEEEERICLIKVQKERIRSSEMLLLNNADIDDDDDTGDEDEDDDEDNDRDVDIRQFFGKDKEPQQKTGTKRHLDEDDDDDDDASQHKGKPKTDFYSPLTDHMDRPILIASTKKDRFPIPFPNMLSIEQTEWHRAITITIFMKAFWNTLTQHFFLSFDGIKDSFLAYEDNCPFILDEQSLLSALRVMVQRNEVICMFPLDDEEELDEEELTLKHQSSDPEERVAAFDKYHGAMNFSLMDIYNKEKNIVSFVTKNLHETSANMPLVTNQQTGEKSFVSKVDYIPPAFDKDGREFKLSDQQMRAIYIGSLFSLSIICGGGGTGKTTLLIVLAYLLRKIYPTGLFIFTAKKRDTVNALYTKIMGYPLRNKYSDMNMDVVTKDKNGIESGNVIFATHDSLAMQATVRQPVAIFGDESGMTSTVDLERFLKISKGELKHLCLVGDDQQLAPLLPGVCFYYLKRLLTMVFPQCIVELTRCFRANTNKLLSIHKAVLQKKPEDLKEDKNDKSFIMDLSLPEGHRCSGEVNKAVCTAVLNTLKKIDKNKNNYENTMALCAYRDQTALINVIMSQYYFDDHTTNEELEKCFIKRGCKPSQFNPTIYRRQRIVFNLNEEVSKEEKAQRKGYARGQLAEVVGIYDSAAKYKNAYPSYEFIESNSRSNTSEPIRSGYQRFFAIKKLPETTINGTHVVHFSSVAQMKKMLSPANCLTVMRSQGAEFHRVIAVMLEGQISDNKLVYTAFTRAMYHLALIGNADSVSDMIMKESHVANSNFIYIIQMEKAKAPIDVKEFDDLIKCAIKTYTSLPPYHKQTAYNHDQTRVIELDDITMDIVMNVAENMTRRRQPPLPRKSDDPFAGIDDDALLAIDIDHKKSKK